MVFILNTQILGTQIKILKFKVGHFVFYVSNKMLADTLVMYFITSGLKTINQFHLLYVYIYVSM